MALLRRAILRSDDLPTLSLSYRLMCCGSRFQSVPKEKADVLVIGAGVVGLAVARALAVGGREVLVVEAKSTFGTGISSRNSEVIHGGIYYPPDSLKANLCMRGRNLLYKYCVDRGISHKKIGKLIVATGPAEIPKLNHLLRIGIENGVDGLTMIDGSEAMQMEPELYCSKALLSSCSGIIDSHSLMLSLLGEAEEHGAVVSFGTSVIGGHVDENGLHLHIIGSDILEGVTTISSLEPQLLVVPKLVINAAGLASLPLAKNIYGLRNGDFSPHYARGCYFTLSDTKTPPFNHLIYPVPVDGGLGVHVTLELDGRVKFGPDVEWISSLDDKSTFLDRFDYTVDPNRASRFYPEIRRYYPNLKDGSLSIGYSGIRPKLSGPKQPPVDFIIQGEEVHGVPGLVNLFGIESPGLTSCLAIGEYILSKFSRY
ncbi:FAD-dependent oxidoreductase family protein [Zostera marina]|uniref:L-2-hydroxyglutarate dehydrogenase, mitochondrial n=1 Tax=Zostera marina TaxID=29655 RepID=A0A0K9PRY8_ZOSMR|nr:FAD-dependent oxidoreductase family protein [Zostera marina]